MGKSIPSNEMPLQPQVLVEPFEKWALYFVGQINSPSKQKKCILISMDYVTKRVEDQPFLFETENVVAKRIWKAKLHQ